MARAIKRDPFGRRTLMRYDVTTLNFPECKFCGGKNSKGQLYWYGWETDTGRVEGIEGDFCSIGCMRAYHGQEE